MASEGAPSVTETAGQVADTATQTASQAVGAATDAAASVTNTAEQAVRETTQPVEPAVDTAKDAAASVTNTAEQAVREATQPVKPAVDTAKDVASSVTNTAEQTVRKVTQPAPEPEGTETDGPAPAVPPVIDTDPANTISDTDSEGGHAGGRSTSPTADSEADNRRAGAPTTTRTDSSRQTGVSGAGTGSDRVSGGVATTSVKPASAVTAGSKESAAGRVRRTTTRSSQSAIVPPRTVSTQSGGPRTDLGVAQPRSTAAGAQPPSSENAADSSPFSFSLPGFSWPSSLPSPLVLAQWLLYTLTALLVCIAVLLASGFWARHRVLKF